MRAKKRLGAVECGEKVQGDRSVLGRAMGMFSGQVELAALQD
jgi:hypothetical protein